MAKVFVKNFVLPGMAVLAVMVWQTDIPTIRKIACDLALCCWAFSLSVLVRDRK